MLKIQCDSCHLELTEPGGLLFSPPTLDKALQLPICAKIHVCVKCFQKLITMLADMPQDPAGWMRIEKTSTDGISDDDWQFEFGDVKPKGRGWIPLYPGVKNAD